MSTLSASSLKIDFPEYQITSDPFQVKPGEWCEIKGPSGFGKTTLMRGILGFQKMEGEVRMGTKRIDLLPVHERNFGVVFQDHLLFPHLNAVSNALFGIKLRRKITAEDEAKARAAFQVLGIESRFEAPIQELSGGERQRLSLIRATLFNPDLLVLDEPFKGLDQRSISIMLDYINNWLSGRPVPVLWISHQEGVSVKGVQLQGELQHGQRHFRFTRHES